jgi:CheY-like chemotaxis protein
MQRVALVDDSDDSRELFSYLLRDTYHVTSCANAEEAFEAFRCEPPDIILMDISLPGISGIDALTRIRADDELKHIPVIALTAHAMRGDRERYLQAGFDHYITKPVIDPDSILNLLRQVLP